MINIQKSFKNKKSTLFLVATPIGNLDEISKRTKKILQSVDFIACENIKKFLKIKNILRLKAKIISFHLYNENIKLNNLLKILKNKKKIALVSSSGYPLISDPGFLLVKIAIEKKYNVVPISGPSAILNSLVCSGFPTQPFIFLGFLKKKKNEIYNQLKNYIFLQITIVCFVSVHRIDKTLKILYNLFGDQEICIAREITKIYETFIRGKISEVINNIKIYKGEFTLIISSRKK